MNQIIRYKTLFSESHFNDTHKYWPLWTSIFIVCCSLLSKAWSNYKTVLVAPRVKLINRIYDVEWFTSITCTETSPFHVYNLQWHNVDDFRGNLIKTSSRSRLSRLIYQINALQVVLDDHLPYSGVPLPHASRTNHPGQIFFTDITLSIVKTN